MIDRGGAEPCYDAGIRDGRPMSAKRNAKRTEGRGPLVRGEPVVRGVLGAALEELGRTGYGALRIEDVAARAGVNKTTVYRRWPTKEDLVRAALLSITADRFVVPNTGSLRTDLLAIAHGMVELTRSCEGQGLMRMIVAEGPDSELGAIAKSLRKTHEAVPRSVIEAAQARGELAPDIDAMLLFDVLVAALHRRLLMDRKEVDDGFLTRLLDLLLLGALASHERGGPPRARGVKAAPRPRPPVRRR
jgi:AcrR family transcriptional regulator